eukprot:13384249-Alexandrium_andersonii.AAC.1
MAPMRGVHVFGAGPSSRQYVRRWSRHNQRKRSRKASDQHACITPLQKANSPWKSSGRACCWARPTRPEAW